MTITVIQTKWIIIAGNPHDGFEFHGPFDDKASAEEYGNDYFGGDDWYACQLDQYKHE